MPFALSGGQFLNGDNSPIANGRLVLTLSGAATVIATGSGAPSTYSFDLDANGVLAETAVVLGNAELSPAGTFYTANVYNSSDVLAWGPISWVVGPSTAYQGTLYPNLIVLAGTFEATQADGDIPVSTGSFALSGWGSGASVTSVRGWDYAHEFTVNSGTGPSAGPTITMTFADGAKSHAPIVAAFIVSGTGQKSWLNVTATVNGYVLTFLGTPQPSKSYVIHVLSSDV